MVISRRRFAENGKEMYRNKKKLVKGVYIFCFCSLNLQNLWRCCCRSVVNLKLPNRELSNHGNDDKNVTNLHTWQWKRSSFARFARAFYIAHTFRGLSRQSYQRQIKLRHINSRVVSAHFAGQTTWNNREMISERRSCMFMWHCRCG